MAEITLNVTNLQNSERLDTYVIKNISDISRSKLKNGLTELLLNGNKAKLAAKVKNGDKIFISWKNPIPSDIIPENIPLDILYEDDNVTVINKKQGMVTHPANGNWTGTLVNALLFHWGRDALSFSESLDKTSTDKSRTGIVHRLDKDTSGTIITAKNPESEEWLKSQFKNRRVIKEYIAIVKGLPKVKNGEVKVQMIRDPKNRKKFTTTEDTTKGKFSHTLYHCIASYGPYTLVKLRLKTGRTHQIRVHMKYLGCPILGDPIYGIKDKNFETATLMLHAKHLGIRLPGENNFSNYYAPTPIRFKKVMQKLHKMYQKTTWISEKNFMG